MYAEVLIQWMINEYNIVGYTKPTGIERIVSMQSAIPNQVSARLSPMVVQHDYSEANAEADSESDVNKNHEEDH